MEKKTRQRANKRAAAANLAFAVMVTLFGLVYGVRSLIADAPTLVCIGFVAIAAVGYQFLLLPSLDGLAKAYGDDE